MIYYKESFVVDGQIQFRNRAARSVIEMLTTTMKHAVIMNRIGVSIIVDLHPDADFAGVRGKYYADSLTLDRGFNVVVDKPADYTGGRNEEDA